MSLRIVALVVLVLVAAATAQARVGELGTASRIELTGVQAFDADAVLDEVLGAPGALAVLAPAAPLDDLVAWLRERIRQGYLWSGHRDVVVEVTVPEGEGRLRVQVVEGVVVRAAAATVESRQSNAEVVAAVEAALHGEGGQQGLWRAGGPARFGHLADEVLHSRVLAACRRAGAISAAARIERVAAADGAVGLRVELENAAQRPIASVRCLGISEFEAARVLERIGFVPGAIARQAELDALVDAVTGTGRYRSVVIDPPVPADGPLDPLTIRVVPTGAAPAWDRMPWDELEALTAAVRGLGQRFADGAHLHVEVALGAGSEGGSAEAWIAPAAVHLRLPAVQAFGVPVGEVRAALDREHGLRIGWSATEDPIRIPLPDLEGRGGALFRIEAIPAAGPDGGNSLSYGGILSKDLAADVARLERKSIVAFDGPFALVMNLHPASLLAMLEKFATRDPKRPQMLWIGPPGDADALEIDRSMGAAAFAYEADGVSVRLVHGPIPPFDLRPSHAPAARDAGSDPLVLMALAAEAVAEVASRGLADDQQHGERLPFFSGFATASDGIAPIAQRLGAALADDYGAGTWPHVLARDLPWLAIDPSGTWPRLSTELRELRENGACGPLGWGLAAAVGELLGAAELRGALAAAAESSCTFDAAWRDIERLTATDGRLGRAIRGVGARWRASADRLSPPAAEVMRGLDDDLAAVRAGMRIVWDAGAGDALRELFRRWQ